MKYKLMFFIIYIYLRNYKSFDIIENSIYENKNSNINEYNFLLYIEENKHLKKFNFKKYFENNLKFNNVKKNIYTKSLSNNDKYYHPQEIINLNSNQNNTHLNKINEMNVIYLYNLIIKLFLQKKLKYKNSFFLNIKIKILLSNFFLTI